MKVNWIEVKSEKSLTIEKIYFNDMSLLVGQSGVGKSQILKHINFMSGLLGDNKRVCNNLIQDICEYTVSFEAMNDNYIYKAKIDPNDFKLNENDNGNNFKIICESLKKNEEEILYNRNIEENILKIKGYEKIPMVKENDSVLNIFSREDVFINIHREIDKIYDLTKITELNFNISKKLVDDLLTKINETKNTNEYRNKKVNKEEYLMIRGASYKALAQLLYFYNKERFNKVKEIFKDIFSSVEDIEVICNEEKQEYELILKEYGCDYWIEWEQISSGMKKTFSFLVVIESIPEDSIILIDEFENSLGNNCLDELSDFILGYGRNIQFIITSHHPYIINNIPADYWKIITRKNSVIKNNNAKELGIGSTKYDAFFELINYLEDEGEE